MLKKLNEMKKEREEEQAQVCPHRKMMWNSVKVWFLNISEDIRISVCSKTIQRSILNLAASNQYWLWYWGDLSWSILHYWAVIYNLFKKWKYITAGNILRFPLQTLIHILNKRSSNCQLSFHTNSTLLSSSSSKASQVWSQSTWTTIALRPLRSTWIWSTQAVRSSSTRLDWRPVSQTCDCTICHRKMHELTLEFN